MSRWDALQPRQNNSKEKKRNVRTDRNWTRRFDDNNSSGQSRIQSFQNKNDTRGTVDRISDPTLHKDLANQWNEIMERIYLQTKNLCADDNGDLTKANVAKDTANSNLSQNLKELRKIAHECMRPGFKLSLSARSKGRSVATLVGFCVSNSRKIFNEKSEILDVVLDIMKISNDISVDITAEESITCIQHLVLEDTDTGHLQVDDACTKPLECIVALLPFAAKHLPAEETANNLVRNILVPHVVDFSGNKNRKCILAMRGLQFLLNDESRKHASAILAPLVVDVTESGEEKRIINPLHQQIVQGLTGKISDNNVKALGLDSDSILNHACTTLTCVLNCIRLIENYDKSQRISCERHNINIQEMESFFQKILQLPQITDEAASVPPIQANVLKLLLALLQTYPDASSVLGRLLVSQKLNSLDLVPPKSPSIVSGRTCQCRLSTPLMTLVHTTSQLSLPAILCTEELLKTMPLYLWLTGRIQPIVPESTSQRAIGSGSLNRSMSCSVEQLLKVIRCRLQSEKGHSDVLARICHLVTCVMFTVPFCSDVLIDEGVKLISATSLFYVKATNPNALDVLGQCLLECMGGRLKPQGGRTKMPIPVKEWLSSKATSRPFINAVFASSSTSKETLSFKILAAMTRTEPGLSLSQSGWWEKFHDFFMNYIMQNSSVQTNWNVLTLFENILLGRKEFGTNADLKRTNDIVRILRLIVPEALSSISTPVSLRSASLNVFGALAEEDWAALFATSGAEGVCHIDTVLNNCTSGESNASLRSVACRALGNICMECFTMKTTETTSVISSSLSFDSAKSLCEGISSTLITALQDAAGSVRSMALFALGNLVQTLYRLNDDCLLLNCALLTKLANITCACLNDSNDKVVGNAIRTSGHVTLLLFQRYSLQQQDIGGKTQWDSCKFYLDLLNALSGKVTTAFTEADGQTKKHTWKERSMIRKHGWGACASLALLLKCRIVTEQESILQASKDAITSMVVCLQHVDTMNEKVIIASASTLCSVSPLVWSSVSSGSSGIVGLALTPCIAELFAPQQQLDQQKKKKFKRFHQELYKLLKNLLRVGTIYDICCVLKNETITKAMLERLYDWMIIESQHSDNLEASAFGVFALALQRKDILSAMTASRDNNVVDLQQKFASRALERHRKEQYQQLCISTATVTTTTTVSKEEPSFTGMNLKDSDKADDEEEFDEL